MRFIACNGRCCRKGFAGNALTSQWTAAAALLRCLCRALGSFEAFHYCRRRRPSPLHRRVAATWGNAPSWPGNRQRNRQTPAIAPTQPKAAMTVPWRGHGPAPPFPPAMKGNNRRRLRRYVGRKAPPWRSAIRKAPLHRCCCGRCERCWHRCRHHSFPPLRRPWTAAARDGGRRAKG